MNDKIVVPCEKGDCSCCLSENTSILFCPINNCDYVLCYECINKIKHNENFDGKCPACRNYNINLMSSICPEDIDMQEFNEWLYNSQDEEPTENNTIEGGPIWLNRHLNIICCNYKPFITTCYFNPFKIYYKTIDDTYFIVLKFYYGSSCYMSNIYTIRLFNRFCFSFLFHCMIILLVVAMGIFIGRTFIWLLMPFPNYWIDFGYFILIGILGCIVFSLGVIVLLMISMMLTSTIECCFIDNY